MKKLNAEFVMSGGKYLDIPLTGSIEFCIAGRSNTGKSSFINHVFNNQRLAKVSKTPGRTRTANYFRISDGCYWIDLPGYGYAYAPRDEKKRWSKLINECCTKRDGVSGIIWLLDIRHPGTKTDREAYEWFCELGMPVLPVFTKCDKLKKNKISKNISEYRKIFPVTENGVKYSVMKEDSRNNFISIYSSFKKDILYYTGNEKK